MSIHKFFIFEKLIGEYVKTPPSLQEQATIQLAIWLCQHPELRRAIFAPKPRPVYEDHEDYEDYEGMSRTAYEDPIEKLSTDICKKLPLPPNSKYSLVISIQYIAEQLVSWNKQHRTILNASPFFTDSLLTPSDWTVDGRLNDKKIAERLVRDERLPIIQRYRLACLNCLETCIINLLKKVPPENRENVFHEKQHPLVRLWCDDLLKAEEIFIGRSERFWKDCLQESVKSGCRTAVVHCWEKVSEKVKDEVIIENAKRAVSKFNSALFMTQLLNKLTDSASPLPSHYTDIFYFLVSEMSSAQKLSFFQEAIITHEGVLDCFRYPPYQDLFLPVISTLWDILPEARFVDQLLKVLEKYCKTEIIDSFSIMENCMEYDYGSLLIELLEQAPECLKRYVFNSYITLSGHIKDSFINLDESSINLEDSTENTEDLTENTEDLTENTEDLTENSDDSYIEITVGVILLFLVIVKADLVHGDINIFQRILQQATIKERNSIICSNHGNLICKWLALTENWNLLNWTLEQCLSSDAINIFKKQFMLSKLGNDVCFQTLLKVSDESVMYLFNWASLSKEEIYEIKTKVSTTCYQNKLVKLLQEKSIQIDCLDNLMRRCLSEDAREKYKEQFLETHAVSLCAHFLKSSDWEEASHLLNWCFPSEDTCWSFKRAFFDSKGVSLEANFFMQKQWNNLALFIEWFRLPPAKISQLKNDVLFSHEVMKDLFYAILFTGVEKVTFYLSWGLDEKETVMAFKEIFQTFLINSELNSIFDINTQEWYDELIKNRLRDLECKNRRNAGRETCERIPESD